jgi:hypothetical protein
VSEEMTYEEDVLVMLGDLAAADAIPSSIKYMNEMARRQLVEHPEILAPGIFTQALLADLEAS